MDLNAAQRRPFKPNRNYSKLTKEEKDQRFKKGQCFYCKATGHYVSECPVAKTKKDTAGNSNWKKPDARKALVSTKAEFTKGIEKGKVVYSLNGTDDETLESKN